MARLKRSTAIVGALLSALLLSGCLVDFGERDISQFAPLKDPGVNAVRGPGAPPEGFFGDGLLGAGDILDGIISVPQQSF